jgi:hypothetical protein
MKDTLTYYHVGHPSTPEFDTFRIEGELPEGTRWVTIQIAGRDLGMRVVRRVKEAREIIEMAFLKGNAPQDWYRLVPAQAPTGMSDEAKEKLRDLSAKRKAAKAAEQAELEQDEKSAAKELS